MIACGFDVAEDVADIARGHNVAVAYRPVGVAELARLAASSLAVESWFPANDRPVATIACGTAPPDSAAQDQSQQHDGRYSEARLCAATTVGETRDRRARRVTRRLAPFCASTTALAKQVERRAGRPHEARDPAR